MILQIAKLIMAIAFLIWVLEPIVVKYIKSKKPPCDSCNHLNRRDGDEMYRCELAGAFYIPPIYCGDYKQRMEDNDD